MNKEPLFIPMASVRKTGGGGKQTLSETGWESISCQSAFQSQFVVIVSKSMTTSGLREQKDTSKQP